MLPLYDMKLNMTSGAGAKTFPCIDKTVISLNPRSLNGL